MNILSVVNKITLKRFLETTRTEYNMVALVEQYEEALNVSDVPSEEKPEMLTRFKNTVVSYVPEYKPKRKTKIPHPLANETSGLPIY